VELGTPEPTVASTAMALAILPSLTGILAMIDFIRSSSLSAPDLFAPEQGLDSSRTRSSAPAGSLRLSLLPVGTLPMRSEQDSRVALSDLEVTVSGDGTPADTLDAIGLLCPEPLFQARTAIDALEPGEVLEVLADDPAAEEDLARFAKRAGHEIVAVEDEGDYKRFLIRRGA